jgi:uncharacterized membrane protein YphA (DoxX/SURF4 family)
LRTGPSVLSNPKPVAYRRRFGAVQPWNPEDPGLSSLGQSAPTAFSLSWIAGLFELVLGVALLIGFYGRVSAFVLSGLMAFAYFIAHFPRGFYLSQNGGVAAILFCRHLPLSRHSRARALELRCVASRPLT